MLVGSCSAVLLETLAQKVTFCLGSGKGWFQEGVCKAGRGSHPLEVMARLCPESQSDASNLSAPATGRCALLSRGTLP